MKHRFLILFFCLLFPIVSYADTRIDPAWEVSEDIVHLLDIARNELGYIEGAHGYTKYGEWSGDPYSQWCAEFLCWCVNETDHQYGTQLLENMYPLYSSSNVGKNWFIEHGRYIVRWGNLDGWGYQWLKGENEFISTGTYIPQPGDWVFFTWTSDQNTDHVAMVEYCTRSRNGHVTIHVIEGNTPNAVKRAEYDLTYGRILGFGTVHDVADWTMRSGNRGEKVRQLQTKLAKIGYLSEEQIDARFGPATQNAVMSFQIDQHLSPNGIANITMQKELNTLYLSAINQDPETWVVSDGTQDDFFDLDRLFSFPENEAEEEISWDTIPSTAGEIPENELLDNMDSEIQDEAPEWVNEN
ncbi:MAG: CHAP domain-containing protein [Clostridia bacterium]|nr:CHAP domain-containing protein [Clostridia bacterium]